MSVMIVLHDGWNHAGELTVPGARVAPQIVILCQEGISLNENLLTVSDRKDYFELTCWLQIN